MAETAGYSGTTLAKKLGIKDSFHITLVNQPDAYLKLFDGLPPNIRWYSNMDMPDMDMIHIFVSSKDLYTELLDRAKKMIKKSGSIWVSWPKKTSGIITDINENIIRETALNAGLVDVKVCAVNETWSGLKLVYRLKDR